MTEQEHEDAVAALQDSASFFKRNPNRWIRHLMSVTTEEGHRSYCAVGAVDNFADTTRARHIAVQYAGYSLLGWLEDLPDDHLDRTLLEEYALDDGEMVMNWNDVGHRKVDEVVDVLEGAAEMLRNDTSEIEEPDEHEPDCCCEACDYCDVCGYWRDSGTEEEHCTCLTD